MRTEVNTQAGAVNTLSGTANYQADPLAVYKALCQQKPHTVLLESAEIDKKHKLKSLLVTDAALKIACLGNTVTFTPLSLNGEAALSFIRQPLAEIAEITEDGNQVIATFSPTNINLDELARLQAHNVFDALRLVKQIINSDHHDFAVFLAGCFAFDLMEVAEQLPEVATKENTCPDYVFYLAETIVVIDHEKRTSEIIGNVFSGEHQQKCYFEISRRLSEIKSLLTNAIVNETIIDISTTAANSASTASATPDISDQAFCQHVEALKEHIRAGDIFQVVPSRTFSLPCSSPLNSYQALKLTNPSPYMFFMQDEEFCIFGASPESALKYQASTNQVELYPIAGTRPRGKVNGKLSPDLDSRIELALRQDQKELAEHIMLVDLARNDIARVAVPGTRHVADLLKVDRYSHVMHLVSRVCGQLKPELDALHAYQACMNMGTLSGAPKVKATELIRKVESKRRGSYGGAVGYMTGNGDMDTCIVIRSAFVANNTAYVQAGAGVVFDSNPQAEANETKQKAQAVINAIYLAEQQGLQGVSDGN
ncbi:anthranilate synthase component 1 [Colwellia sp. MEBiC06753]